MVGTQPWPIGRYGSCELMIGCIAKARNYEVFVNTKEMEDVQVRRARPAPPRLAWPALGGAALRCAGRAVCLAPVRRAGEA